VVEGLARLWVVSGAGVECQKEIDTKQRTMPFLYYQQHSQALLSIQKKRNSNWRSTLDAVPVAMNSFCFKKLSKWLSHLSSFFLFCFTIQFIKYIRDDKDNPTQENMHPRYKSSLIKLGTICLFEKESFDSWYCEATFPVVTNECRACSRRCKCATTYCWFPFISALHSYEHRDQCLYVLGP
jgi:hypothetical protein